MSHGADERIGKSLEEGRSFLLDAGAGSGKTRSLCNALTRLRHAHEGTLLRTGRRIACITFTNVAADEVRQRIGDAPSVSVSTIHVFLWNVFGSHQRELRKALLVRNASLEPASHRRVDGVALEAAISTMTVSYSEMGANFLDGRIFHDDVLAMGRWMCEKYPRLVQLIAAKYPFILVDEYQDTSAAVVEILERVVDVPVPRAVVGLFGDKFQSIYHSGEQSGVGEIPTAFAEKLEIVKKPENWRCSRAVLAVLNRVRTDIEQVPGGECAEGVAAYVSVKGAAPEAVIEVARDLVQQRLGGPLEVGTEKILMLTHRLIAERLGYPTLLDIFKARGDRYRQDLITGTDARITFFRERLEPVLEAWERRDHLATLSALRAAGFELGKAGGRAATKAALDRLEGLATSGTVGGAVDWLGESALIDVPDLFEEATEQQAEAPESADVVGRDDRRERRRVFIDALRGLRYLEVRNFCRFFSEHTPYSTKHGAKGAEFDTVFVVLDDEGAKWFSDYSFGGYLSGEDETKKPKRYRQTRNLFYVCCSRAMRNLVVIDLGKRSALRSSGAGRLFGEDWVLEANGGS